MKKSGYEQRDLIKFNFASLDLDSNEFCGNSPPSVFVGRFGYPKVNVGVLSPVKKQKNAYLLDNPKEWVKRDLKDEDILKLRSQLVNARFQSSVKHFEHRLLNLSQEVGMAHKPVDMEVFLKDKPKNMLKMNSVLSPLSNNANVKNIKLTENPKIKTHVEKVTSDYDLKSIEGVYKLYNKGFDENFLSKILSIGLLGIKKNRKLVPSRWSVTGTDSVIGNKLLEEIKYYKNLETSLVYFGGYLGNYYLILFLPGIWSYELFEMGAPLQKNPWSKSGETYATDYEDYFGRKNYVQETAGAFYATRLVILERLKNLKKQASILVLRFITEEDRFPLGVFVCREGSRKSVNSKPLEFEDKNLAITYAKSFAKKKYGIDINVILKKSKLLNESINQKRISEFI